MTDWELTNEQNLVKVIYTTLIGPEIVQEKLFEENKKPAYYQKHAIFLDKQVIDAKISEPYRVKTYTKEKEIEALNGTITSLEVGIKDDENLRFLRLYWDYIDDRFPKNKLRPRLNGYYFNEGKPAEFQTIYSMYDQWPTDYPKILTNEITKELQYFLQGNMGDKLWDNIVLSYSHLIKPGPEYKDENIEKIKSQYIILE